MFVGMFVLKSENRIYDVKCSIKTLCQNYAVKISRRNFG